MGALTSICFLSRCSCLVQTRLGVLSGDGVQVMLRIYEAVHSSWSAIRRCFLTSDPTRIGSVTVQDFRKVR